MNWFVVCSRQSVRAALVMKRQMGFSHDSVIQKDSKIHCSVKPFQSANGKTHFKFDECICKLLCNYCHNELTPKSIGQRRKLSVFESSCHLPTCLSHTVKASHCLIKLLNVKQGSCEYQFFIVFALNRQGIEPESTASVADAQPTRSLIAMNPQQIIFLNLFLHLISCQFFYSDVEGIKIFFD